MCDGSGRLPFEIALMYEASRVTIGMLFKQVGAGKDVGKGEVCVCGCD